MLFPCDPGCRWHEGGLGRAAYRAFLEAGATVLATYRTQPGLDALRVVAAGRAYTGQAKG